MPEECEGCPLAKLRVLGGGDKVTRLARRAFISCARSFVLLIRLARTSVRQDLTRDLQSLYPKPTWDRLLRPEAAAETFGVSRQYFYDHELDLPFTVRLPNGVLRISEQGMLAWIEEHRGDRKG